MENTLETSSILPREAETTEEEFPFTASTALDPTSTMTTQRHRLNNSDQKLVPQNPELF